MSAPQKRKLLFLQLPLLDNDVKERRENLPMAAFYLGHALERSSESKHWKICRLSFQTLEKSDAVLRNAILRLCPDVLALTLYLWNIERTLDLVEQVKRKLPSLRVIAGGPEVAADHPFLFRRACVDVAVYGEGEPVFPHILRALRQRRTVDFLNVAWRHGGEFSWGRNPPPAFDLLCDLPPAAHRGWRPDPSGMAYMETIRGCPLRCAFCCYGHRRRRMTALPVDEVARRARILLKRGARDLRFVDPTFNARRDFDRLLVALAQLNRRRQVELFAELRGESLTRRHAELLARAGFREAEVGMQSRDSETLRLIRRPTRLRALDRGIRYMARAGIRVTVDLMYGLPRQTLGDIRRMIRWAARQRNVRIQCLQTLLLPGTELSERRSEWGLEADSFPPYAVRRTATLSAEDIRAAEEEVRKRLNVVWDCPTRRFVGRSLPDLFGERIGISAAVLEQGGGGDIVPNSSCCAVLIRGVDLFQKRHVIRPFIARLIAAEPHILWQFVLAPAREEPLDLLDELATVLAMERKHVLDRFIQLHSPGLRAARRLFVLLDARREYSRSWQLAAEELLRTYFY